MTMKIPALVLSLMVAVSSQEKIYEPLLSTTIPYSLPELGFSYDALEPHIDKATVRVHHTGHHKAYTDKMNKVLQLWREQDPDSKLAHSSIITILEHISEVPSDYQTQLRNHGGGYVNHVFYWSTLCPAGKATNQPEGELLSDLELSFGSFDVFMRMFSESSVGLFGSGYVWLVEDGNGKLSLTTTINQNSPLSDGQYPLLVIDVWEHAYYLKHKNKRLNYTIDWWSIICWSEVQELRKFWRQCGRVNDSNKNTEL